MITGIHTLFYSSAPDEARAFLSDVLGLPSIDVGGGWLIFGAPPGELAIHPTDDAHEDGKNPVGPTEVYLMCSDIRATLTQLRAKGVEVTKDVSDQRWGLLSALRVPGGGEIGIYEPRHPTALSLSGAAPSHSRSRPQAKKGVKKLSSKGQTRKRE
jgi:catechol 2,3-dioxygenase-like lactoylglutathione lyase family enzyme